MSVYISFVLLAAGIVYGANKLSKEAEVIEANSKINVLLIGALLALATSLPELATGITSAFIGQSAMSVSNVLGSNIFNLVILAVMNLAFYKRIINHRIEDQTNKFSIVVILIYVVFMVGISTSASGALEVFNFNLTSIFIIMIYFIGVKVTSAKDVSTHEKQNQNADKKVLQKSFIRFGLFAIIVLIISVLLSLKAEQIMELTGLNASFVGAIFIGVSTSLPELVTTIALVRHKHFNLAAAGILGSNLFNFTILSIVDFVSTSTVYSYNTGIMVLAVIGIVFSILTYLAIRFSKENRYFNLVVPAIIVVGYFVYIING